jgi:fructosamine-3-kinase
VGGGCINETLCLEGEGRKFFIKLNDAARVEMLEAEAAGLQEIRASQSLRAPEPIALGTSNKRCWLALEYIELKSPRASTSELLGQQLARMHRNTADTFGWERDNTIGATPQPNPWSENWPRFFRDHRLGFQLALAAARGAPSPLIDSGNALTDDLEDFFADYRPQPSLLHGDLWGGNWGADEHGLPVIYDPAVYFGDREADLAMTELFGGFDSGFYSAYQADWPLDSGYSHRKHLYNLYHILNHFNLFGGSYANQAQNMIERLLAELS